MTAHDREEPHVALNRLFVRALLALAEAGDEQRQLACTFAALAWSALRHRYPREAERFNGVLHSLTRTQHHPNQEENPVPQTHVLDVRALIPMERHRLIFETYERLAPGERFVLVNDHDPKPLYYQFAAEHAGQFTWKYLEQGPVTWRVEIGRTAAQS